MNIATQQTLRMWRIAAEDGVSLALKFGIPLSVGLGLLILAWKAA